MRKSKECYFCGEASTSFEHVPPKCIFPSPKDFSGELRFRQGLITVPSCDKHNLGKAKDDEYLMAVLAMNQHNNLVGVRQGVTKVVRSMQKQPGLRKAVLVDPKPIHALNPRTGVVTQTAMFTIDYNRLKEIFQHIARGLYFHHFRIRWTGCIRVLLEFDLPHYSVDQRQQAELRSRVIQGANSLFRNADRHGQNQSVFYYQIAVDSASSADLAMRLTFYGGTRVSLAFTSET